TAVPPVRFGSDIRRPSLPRASDGGTPAKLRRLGSRGGIEGLAPGRHVAQQLRHLELLAVRLGQLVALGDELLDADLVDQADGTTGLRREAETHDRADVAV